MQEKQSNPLLEKQSIENGSLEHNDKTLEHRNFTAIVKSQNVRLYYLSREDLVAFLRYLPLSMVKEEIENRMNFLDSQVGNLIKVAKDTHKSLQK